jgi:HAD superfamily hydrolase (TIGR01509 family)
MGIKAVIFDLDGTITEPFLDFDAIRRDIGLAANSGTILEEMRHMTAQEKQRAFAIIERHEEIAVANSTLNVGTKQTLDWLTEQGIPVGVITRNRKASVIGVARKHDLNFAAIVDREDGPVKPDAYGILKLCRLFHAQPRETIMVGDYIHDIQAAKAAGAIAVLLKNHAQADEFALCADYSIMRIDELITIIESINQGIPGDG